ncbi:MAG: hypothetical protein WKG01_05240 [Kofleriaceae bacterium]
MSRPPVLLLALALALMPLAVSAQPAGNTEEAARANFTRGKALAASRKFADAYREFEAGYRASPKPAFLFNMGEAARGMGDVVKARAAGTPWPSQRAPWPHRAQAARRARASRRARTCTAAGSTRTVGADGTDASASRRACRAGTGAEHRGTIRVERRGASDVEEVAAVGRGGWRDRRRDRGRGGGDPRR